VPGNGRTHDAHQRHGDVRDNVGYGKAQYFAIGFHTTCSMGFVRAASPFPFLFSQPAQPAFPSFLPGKKIFLSRACKVTLLLPNAVHFPRAGALFFGG
jgi:hypothetical protein